MKASESNPRALVPGLGTGSNTSMRKMFFVFFFFKAGRSYGSSILPMQHPRQVQGSPQSCTTAVTAKILPGLRRFSQPRGRPTGLARALGTCWVCPGLSISQHWSEKCHCGFQNIREPLKITSSPGRLDTPNPTSPLGPKSLIGQLRGCPRCSAALSWAKP